MDSGFPKFYIVNILLLYFFTFLPFVIAYCFPSLDIAIHPIVVMIYIAISMFLSGLGESILEVWYYKKKKRQKDNTVKPVKK